ncbi:hypothetical protein BOTCAL_0048g00100 [Botryotinia calthae]|uniref:2,6-dihydroxypyridine 3-monooxygenase substrate binding domain-containing protein n=1 Tax=Botryotinia calthae TaxID=38488 RepID=A0A4Y8DB53_9HELO|nr:hypothetical protein BOTCAL_0048g00100 [Botryotinia calthae]
MNGMTIQSASKDIVIVGGSLASLMHGIMLKHLGHNVRILEKSLGSSPDNHMAGVCAASDVLSFLERFDQFKDHPLGIPSVCLQSIDQENHISVFLKVQRLMTSWDALYFRLRANFDGLPSEYFQSQPSRDSINGSSAVYETGKQVISLENTGSKMRIEHKDLVSGLISYTTADLVIGADGPNSIVRNTFLPTVDRRYAGYIAWRGVVAEEEVSEETRKIFQRNITYSVVTGGHAIVYNIPGKLGSIGEGKRLLNFCWYTNEPEVRLDDVMTDREGRRHYTSISSGSVREAVWTKQKELGSSLMSTPYIEIISKIEKPFVHIISDYYSPKASFANGKVLLVGDALTLLRPHIAFSTNQAAYHCMMVEKLIKGEIDIRAWEVELTRFGYLHWRRSIWYGEYFQRPLFKSILMGLKYWFVAAGQTIKYWGENKQMTQ